MRFAVCRCLRWLVRSSSRDPIDAPFSPRTPEGKARTIAAHTKHRRRSRAHVALVREINAKLQKITYELKRDGLIP